MDEHNAVDTDRSNAVAAALEADTRWRRDPLAQRLNSSVVQRELVMGVKAGWEVLLRAAGKAGKTEIGAALIVSLCQGRKTLDYRTIREAAAGAPPRELGLPRVPLPAVTWCIVPSYRQAMDGPVASIKAALGGWQYREIPAGPNVGGFLIHYPGAGKSPRTWSRITLIPDDGTDPVGGLIHAAWGDEPPSHRMWSEVRQRWQAGFRTLLWLTLTPKYRREWEWIQRDFAGAQGHPHEGRFELRCSVWDNQALSSEEIEEMKRRARGDPLWRARLYGAYVDTQDVCPFSDPPDRLEEWAQRCGRGEAWDGHAEAERWGGDVDREDDYLVLIDPSAGMRDPEGTHDRAGMWVVAKGARRLVLRLVAYIPPVLLGKIARQAAEEYNSALVVPEMNGGWGEAFLEGLGRYPHVYQDLRPSRLGGPLKRIGWATTMTSRQLCIGALQQCVKDDSLLIESAEAVATLAAAVTDVQGRVPKRPGARDEDLDLAGMAAFLLGRPQPPLPKEMPPERLATQLRHGFYPAPAGPPDRWR